MSESRSTPTKADLEALKALQEDAQELERIESLLDRFNVFEAIGFVGQEVKHSRFLAFLLDPNQSHGLGDLFLRRMLQRALTSSDKTSLLDPLEDLDQIDLGQTLVRREHRHVDILLTNEIHKLAVIIENKVWTVEHSDQLNRYYRIMKDNHPNWQMFGIYLTPFGDTPSHETYLPFGYGAVCEIVEGLLNERGSTLSCDVRMAMKHYTDMVRRHIVDDPEVANLARSLYQKHQRALDLIYKYRPDVKSEIRNLLEGLIRNEPDLERDSRAFGNDILRFAVREWDTPTLLTAKWTRSGRILLFEFWNHTDRLQLKLILGPGPDDVRQRLLDMAQANPSVFDTPHNYVASYYEIFSRTLLEKDVYEDTTDLEAQLRERWAEFLDEDLPRIEEALKKETWIWEFGESEDRT